MTGHPRVLLAEARERSLSHVERRSLDAHLAACVACRGLAATLEMNDRVLARREAPIATPAWAPPRRGSGLVPAALVACAAVVILAVVALPRHDGRDPAAVPATSTPTASPAPTDPAASPSPSPTVTLPRGGIEAHGLGTLAGQFAFTLVTPVPGTGPRGPEVSDLWALPLDGGAPRLAARFTSLDASILRLWVNRLDRQFSPDGRRLLLSVVTPRPGGGSRYSIVLLELESGRTRVIGSDDQDSDIEPAWSPDGRRIAYVRRADTPSLMHAFDEGIWVMSSDGGGARQIVQGSVGANSLIWGWAPDSRTIAWTHSRDDFGFETIDVDGGARASLGQVAGGHPPHSWRRFTPQLAAVFQTAPRQGERYILVADQVAGPQREVVREPDEQSDLRNVRWHPARNEIMYLRGMNEMYALELGGRPVRIPLATTARVLRAEWSPVGNDVLYATGDRHVFFATTLHYARRDGASDRVIFAPRDQLITDLAVRRY